MTSRRPARIMRLLLALTIATLASADFYLDCPKAAYCLAIDESKSITNAQFKYLITGAIEFVKQISIHAPGALFAANVFTTTAIDIVKWETSPTTFEKKLQAHLRDAGGTNIASGLKACQNALEYAPRYGFVVLFSNGGENPPYSGFSVANELRLMGHSLLTVGVRLEPGDHSLDGIGDGPEHVLHVNRFEKIASHMDRFVHQFCEHIPRVQPLCSDQCPSANVCFAVDESSSISPRYFDKQSNVLSGLTSVFAALAPSSLYTGVGFADEAHCFQPVTFDVYEMMHSFLHNKQRKGGSSSWSALLKCQYLIGHLPGPKLIVLIADGEDNKTPKGRDVDNQIKEAGIRIITAGVGSDRSSTLANIASPDDGMEYYTSVASFPVFSQAIGPIIGHMCSASAMWTPTPGPSECADVVCASCGDRLECYVDSGNYLTDMRACAAVEAHHEFCPRRGFVTKCKQKCGYAEHPPVCYTGSSFGLFEHNPKCHHVDHGNVYASDFAKYSACQNPSTKETYNSCVTKACNADTAKHACYPENL